MAKGKQDRIPGIENKLQDLHGAALSYADKRQVGGKGAERLEEAMTT
jgi:hypothetical protein